MNAIFIGTKRMVGCARMLRCLGLARQPYLNLAFSLFQDSGELTLEPWNNGNPIAQKTEIFSERIDSEEKILAYSQEQFNKKVISLRVFRYENDTILTEIFAEKPFTDLSHWDIRFSHDDEMDLHHYC